MSVRDIMSTQGVFSTPELHSNSVVLSTTFLTLIMASPGVLNIPQCTAHTHVYCIDIMHGGNVTLADFARYDIA